MGLAQDRPWGFRGIRSIPCPRKALARAETGALTQEVRQEEGNNSSGMFGEYHQAGHSQEQTGWKILHETQMPSPHPRTDCHARLTAFKPVIPSLKGIRTRRRVPG